MRDTLIDDELMELVGRGSRDAFRQLVVRWQSSLHKFFYLMGVDAGDAPDCVQETFLRVFSYRDRYRNAGSRFRAFVFRIGRNVAVDFFRKAQRDRRVARSSIEPFAEDHVPFSDDRLDCLWALDSLDDRLRVVVVLNVFEGLSYRETAEVLGIPVGTVKSRMHHALLRLREKLRVHPKS